METKAYTKHAQLAGSLIIVGFGSIAQAALPLILRHLEIRPGQITVISADENGKLIAQEFGVTFILHPLTEENYAAVLEPYLNKGDFLLNLSVDVSSIALMELCWHRGALYLDTCIEPWLGGYTDRSIPASLRSNYALREKALAFGREKPKGATAIIAQGANPGLASTFVKRALLDIAADIGLPVEKPASHTEWAELAFRLNIKAIHIAERDTQVAEHRKRRDEFINTWSVDGFVGEALQPSELGWGTHERHWPEGGARHKFGCDAAIYLNRPGAATRIRSWTPLTGPYHGFLITHGESISIADHLTLRRNEKVVYRPTVHYAYHPCDDAVLSLHELAGRNWHLQANKRILRDDITDGMDELGVLLMGHAKGAYWYGSRLSIREVRQLAPYNNATSLQVAAGVLAGMAWALQHPYEGVIEPDDIDYETALEIARPYLGEITGIYSDWTPLRDRGWLFSEDVDSEDPWQFKNIRVT
ncbi:homospermidine synthase [Nitrosovibrio tenuis]|uniref:Homospermidine synthase n=1 Tax=Nitrosovibrio tenuis TaxID=1233 RepID=A0A1H7MC20_9PROT|nr:saccharopine dehydrogenase C-terminal domain-containing protein [Nitrosovibrio tenuis]SEL08619.1 homospermidine synthase [Nitrosovibrio tenuis]